MNKFWISGFKIISKTFFFLSLAIIIFHLYSVARGFYFSGDTISYFEPAYPGEKGDLLSVFLWSYASWPPGVTFVFHFLRFLPLSFISQHQVYVMLISLLNIGVVYLIARKITLTRSWRVVIIVLCLLSGVQAFLLTTALSEPLLIFVWLASIFCLERFISTQRERFLLMYILVASLIPLSRYSGIWVLLSLSLALIFYVLFTWRSKKYSPSFVASAIILTWVPILIYLIRNYILTQTFISGIDALTDFSFKRLDYALTSFLPDIFLDTKIYLLAAILLGLQIKWNKETKIILILSAFSVIIYYFGFALSLTKFRVSSTFHSRYLSVAYPELILLITSVGSFIASRMIKFSNKLAISLVILVLILGNQLLSSIDHFKQEINSPQSLVEGVEYSADVRKICLGKTPNKYLFLQDSSRNWLAQSLGFYCQPINIIPFNADTFDLGENFYLFTPYKLNTPNLELLWNSSGNREMRVYKVTDNTRLNIKQELRRQVPLDWFSGDK